MNDLAGDLAIPPQAEGVAIGIDQVGERLQFAPLILVVRIVEPARISALAWSLDLDEANESIADGHGEIRTRLEGSESCLADKLNGLSRQPADHGQVRMSASRGPRSWSSGAPLMARFANLDFALAPKSETALATVFPANSYLLRLSSYGSVCALPSRPWQPTGQQLLGGGVRPARPLAKWPIGRVRHSADRYLTPP